MTTYIRPPAFSHAVLKALSLDQHNLGVTDIEIRATPGTLIELKLTMLMTIEKFRAISDELEATK